MATYLIQTSAVTMRGREIYPQGAYNDGYQIVPEPLASAIRPGDRLVIDLSGGHVYLATVTAVDLAQDVTEGTFAEYEDASMDGLRRTGSVATRMRIVRFDPSAATSIPKQYDSATNQWVAPECGELDQDGLEACLRPKGHDGPHEGAWGPFRPAGSTGYTL